MASSSTSSTRSALCSIPGLLAWPTRSLDGARGTGHAIVFDIAGQEAPHDTQVWLNLGEKLVQRVMGRRLLSALRPRLGAFVIPNPGVQCAQAGRDLLTCTGQPIRRTEMGTFPQPPPRRELRPAPGEAETTADSLRNALQDGPRKAVNAGCPIRRGRPEVACQHAGQRPVVGQPRLETVFQVKGEWFGSARAARRQQWFQSARGR